MHESVILKNANGKQFLVAIGGKSEVSKNWLSSVESILIDSTNSEKWTLRQPMKTPRSNFASCVFENTVYVFGGIAGSTEGFKPVMA